MKLVANVASGIEAVTKRELSDLGYETQTENGKIYFEGDYSDVAKTNLWLRSADRIQIILANFKAWSFEELFDRIYEIPWEEIIPLNGKIIVNARSKLSKLFSLSDIQAISKRAIIKKLQTVYHRSGHLPETGAIYSLNVRFEKNQAEVLLDTTGDSLFKRGYRIEKGVAPLKENMAASLILLTNWHPDLPFVDPMTGSGTLAIEAALIGANIAPGLKRDFLFNHFANVDPKILEEAKIFAKEAINRSVNLEIFASDLNQNMIAISEQNAHGAGIHNLIQFKQVALRDLELDNKKGVIVVNPPYGQRMGEINQAHELYRQMGEKFIPLNKWSKYIITSDLDFEEYYGEKATKKRKLFNGAIRTDYFQFWGEN
ncbi:THUMP domain-containing class I SAM-dependent RNA methyltransferase [Xylocopilactobacillus apicola]|uniref:RNA methyltransferase n=1 Tax=Xylocopilactobacillus apicola TaxID=2932184 RepID=A0AAU9D8E2_9LACO|nr:class I SAM-dependent RNA methyltransferase [Xylocopilactobacillus apicola]BDR58610.1 RNA methyltransferase [Xylocopilactobacillus apicola]